ncbi:hypothetical protein WJX84_010820 [Apatococcus fuscideae]|uniref:Uncharacterized protein n=1 Tax=Apatococcus fuscideae TaxID=2026836 RepID=A0AAW1RXB1_9CHLO
MYCAKSKKVEVRKRAAFVWIQAEFASKGLENSWQYLQQVFQVDVSLDVVTVWALLMVESGHDLQAEAALHDFLKSHAPAPAAAGEAAEAETEPDSEQRALLRLYMQIVHQNLHKPLAASHWLQQSGLASEQQRKMLLEELQLEQPGRPPGSLIQPLQPDTGPASAETAGDPVAHSAAGKTQQERGGSEGHAESQEPGGKLESREAQGDACSPAKPLASTTADAAGPTSPWWSNAAHEWSEWLDHAPERWGFSPVQCGLGVAGSALLLYAALAERRAMARAGRRLGKKLSEGVLDITTAGLSLQPNPHAATPSMRLPRSRL